jgi:hypothetical protein
VSFRSCVARNMRPTSGVIRHSFSDNIETKGAWDLVHSPRTLQVSLQTLESATNRRWQRLHPGVLNPVGQGLPPGVAGIDFHG